MPPRGRRSAGSRSPCFDPRWPWRRSCVVTGSLLAFDQFYILTKGGPDNSTITIVGLIYNVAFQGQNDLGVASALSVLVLGALIAVNALQMRTFRRPDES